MPKTRRGVAALLVLASLLPACVGPTALHTAVLGYDEAIASLERQMLLVNIARIEKHLPPHFTVTQSVAATFNFQTQLGFNAAFSPGGHSYTPSIGASTSENPTLTIVPVQGEEFTRRILAPLDDSRLEFLVEQGANVEKALRLLAHGLELFEGTRPKFLLNWPARKAEYVEFRRRVLHLGYLASDRVRALHAGPLMFEESEKVRLASPPSPGDLLAWKKEGYRWKRIEPTPAPEPARTAAPEPQLQRPAPPAPRPGPAGQRPTVVVVSAPAAAGPPALLDYELRRSVRGRIAITNYDPRRLSNGERRRLNELADRLPHSHLFVDIRPGHPGGDYPMRGAFKLRSVFGVLAFVAAGIRRVPEYDVAPDPRTPSTSHNPARTLAIVEGIFAGGDSALTARYRGKAYSVAPTAWDRGVFSLLAALFQMTVTDVSRVGPAITISK